MYRLEANTRPKLFDQQESSEDEEETPEERGKMKDFHFCKEA